jgi:DNA polymerase-4
MRVIMHIDMNSYFASCEQQDRPEWRGKPIGVCEHLGGIIIAPSVEAKRWGIKTGMPVWEAKKLYPRIILTTTTPSRYRFYTHRFLKVLGDYTDAIEKYSIDEAFLDLTKASCIVQPIAGQWVAIDPWQEAARIGQEMKRRITAEVGDYLRCSIGIADNKLLAKIASDAQKPDGLTVIRSEDRASWYNRLVLQDVPGIGRRMERRLNALGITTLAQLRDYPLTKLVTHFGVQGHHLHHLGQLQGSWKEDFNHSEPIKSIGHMYTVPKEFRHQPGTFEAVLYKLSEMVAARLRVNGLTGNVLSAYTRDSEYESAGSGRKLGYYIRDGRDIFLEAMRSFRTDSASFAARDQAVYLIGVTVSGLVPYQAGQTSIFASDNKKSQLLSALDKINTKYDDFTIARVPAFLARDIIRDSVGFGRMKEFSKTFVPGSRSRFG